MLQRNSRPKKAELEAAMSEELCCCDIYPRIRMAVNAVFALEDQPVLSLPTPVDS